MRLLEAGSALEPTPGGELESLATQINQQHAWAERSITVGVQHAIAAGKLLAKAKELVGHGNWLPWLEKNCEAIGERTAQIYMRVAREHEVNPQRVSDLSLRDAVRELAEPREPEPEPSAQPVTETIRVLTAEPRAEMTESIRVLTAEPRAEVMAPPSVVPEPDVDDDEDDELDVVDDDDDEPEPVAAAWDPADPHRHVPNNGGYSIRRPSSFPGDKRKDKTTRGYILDACRRIIGAAAFDQGFNEVELSTIAEAIRVLTALHVDAEVDTEAMDEAILAVARLTSERSQGRISEADAIEALITKPAAEPASAIVEPAPARDGWKVKAFVVDDPDDVPHHEFFPDDGLKFGSKVAAAEAFDALGRSGNYTLLWGTHINGGKSRKIWNWSANNGSYSDSPSAAKVGTLMREAAQHQKSAEAQKLKGKPKTPEIHLDMRARAAEGSVDEVAPGAGERTGDLGPRPSKMSR